MSRRRPRRPLSERPIGPILATAHAEAELAGHGYVGLEHLLISLTDPQQPATAGPLAEQGITTERARDAVRTVVGAGRGDGPRYDPATLLATLGVDLDQVRRSVETRFGTDALGNLYNRRVGWSLRPRGPLCGLGVSPQLKRVLGKALGDCWDTAPPHLPERVLLHALDSDSPGLAAVLDDLEVPVEPLRAAITARLPIAS